MFYEEKKTIHWNQFLNGNTKGRLKGSGKRYEVAKDLRAMGIENRNGILHDRNKWRSMWVTAIESRFAEEEEMFVGQTRGFTKLSMTENLFFVLCTTGETNNNEYT